MRGALCGGILAVLAGCAAVPAPAPAAAVPTSPTPTVLVGEVVTLDCYLYSGARGDDHRACAERCLGLGVPGGLLAADGTLYLLVPNVHEHPQGLALAPFAAQRCRVTGELVRRDGMQALFVAEIVPADGR